MAANSPTPLTAQEQRTERAREALRANTFRIAPIGADTWSVKNGDKVPYTVRHVENNWNCTCPDFSQFGPSIRCKHVEAVRIIQEENGNSVPTIEPPIGNEAENDSARIRNELNKPLDMARVKRRQAPGKGTVPYLEGYEMIQRANEIFAFGWSFDLLKDPTIIRWQKTQTQYSQQQRCKVPVLDDQGRPLLEEVGIVWITGKVTVELDGRPICHADVGRCSFTGDTPEALDMAIAGAATDCLKRCLRQFGDQFGLSLYDRDVAQTAGLERGNGHANSHASSSPGGNGGSTAQPAGRTTRQTPPAKSSAPTSAFEAGKVIFTLKPKTRPELSGKTLAELQRQAPDILAWLASDYTPTSETQALKDAARLLVQSKAREDKVIADLGFRN